LRPGRGRRRIRAGILRPSREGCEIGRGGQKRGVHEQHGTSCAASEDLTAGLSEFHLHTPTCRSTTGEKLIVDTKGIQVNSPDDAIKFRIGGPSNEISAPLG
jgi:hypothetical protein